jgi:hypothetical protein
MKLRLGLALVAVAAVLCWLAIPAIRIWQAPALRDHTHHRFSPLSKVSVWRVDPPMGASTERFQSQGLMMQHHASFASRYWAMLLNRRWADADSCGLDGSIVLEVVKDDPHPPKWGGTLFKGLTWLLDRSRAKAEAQPAQ